MFEEYPIWGETCKFGGRELAFDEASQVEPVNFDSKRKVSPTYYV
jgi:hypothetical protein